MKEREKILVSGLVTLMLVVWLGFFFHRSPRFAGSLWGGVLAVGGSTLMLIPLLYLIIKRVPSLKRWVTKWASIRTLLTWHIYAGILGPILVLIHTGHKFDSALGIALTAMTLIVVVSGFIGRYLMSFIGHEIRTLKKTLEGLQGAARRFIDSPQTASNVLSSFSDLPTGAAVRPFPTESLQPDMWALHLAEAIADTEYAIASNETFKRAFGLWLKVHIVLSLVLYGLLGAHIWTGLYFGLRWFS